MKILLLLLFGIALVLASDDQVTELPTPIPVAKLTAPHGLAKRDVAATAPEEKSSSSESSEEKESKIRDSTITISTAVTPIGVIEDKGLPIVEGGLRKRRNSNDDDDDTVKNKAPVEEIPAADAPKIVAKRSEEEFRQPVTEPPKSAITPEGVEKDDGLPEIGLGSRRKRDETSNIGDANYPVTEPPKSAVTPQGVEEDDGLPDIGLGSRRKRETTVTETQKSENIGASVKEIPASDAPKIVAKRSDGDEFREPVTEPPKAAVTPQGVEEDDGLPDIGLGSRRKRDETSDIGDAKYPVTEPPKSAVTPQGVEEDDGLPDIGLGSRKRRSADYASSRARRYA